MEGMIMPIIIGAVIGLIIGFVIAKMLEKNKASLILKSAKKQASSTLKEARIDAEALKKDKILQAKEKFIELKSEHEKVILSRDKKVSEGEKRIREKESKAAQELDRNSKLNKSLDSKIADYDYRIEFLDKKKKESEKAHKRQVEQLEVISGLSADDAKKELVESLKEEAKTDAMAFIQDKIEEAKLTAQQEAKK